MTGTGFAYFCWQRHKLPGELPPGLRWDERGYLYGIPTLPGKYQIECLKGISTPIEVIELPADTAGVARFGWLSQQGYPMREDPEANG